MTFVDRRRGKRRPVVLCVLALVPLSHVVLLTCPTSVVGGGTTGPRNHYATLRADLALGSSIARGSGLQWATAGAHSSEGSEGWRLLPFEFNNA